MTGKSSELILKIECFSLTIYSYLAVSLIQIDNCITHRINLTRLPTSWKNCPSVIPWCQTFLTKRHRGATMKKSELSGLKHRRNQENQIGISIFWDAKFQASSSHSELLAIVCELKTIRTRSSFLRIKRIRQRWTSCVRYSGHVTWFGQMFSINFRRSNHVTDKTHKSQWTTNFSATKTVGLPFWRVRRHQKTVVWQAWNEIV